MATITKRKNGWSVQVRRKGYPQQTRTMETKADALAWAREQEGRIDRASSRATARADAPFAHFSAPPQISYSDVLELLRKTRRIADFYRRLGGVPVQFL